MLFRSTNRIPAPTTRPKQRHAAGTRYFRFGAPVANRTGHQLFEFDAAAHEPGGPAQERRAAQERGPSVGRVRHAERDGERFDPHYHEAVATEDTDEFPPNTICGRSPGSDTSRPNGYVTRSTV